MFIYLSVPVDKIYVYIRMDKHVKYIKTSSSPLASKKIVGNPSSSIPCCDDKTWQAQKRNGFDGYIEVPAGIFYWPLKNG